MATFTIQTRTRSEVVPATDPVSYTVWSEWATAADTSNLTDTLLVEYRTYDDVVYVDEYVEAYEQLVATSMASDGDGKDSILEKQFALLEASDEHLTAKEIIGLKNQAYSNLRQQIMLNSQKTAMALVEKKHRFMNELEQQSKQLDILSAQIEKANYDAEYVLAQTKALEEQVIDNRKIKALDSMADTYGTFGAGGISVHSDMWGAYFDIVVDLAGGAAPTNVTPYKVT